MRVLAFFGGVPGAITCDGLKSGVARTCRYEPEIQRTYEDLARHYGTTVLPARPYKPRDKAKVEVAVQVVQRWGPRANPARGVPLARGAERAHRGSRRRSELAQR